MSLPVAAPMVRYSKLPFRLLLRQYNVDVVYTPMILAAEFVRSAVARENDFTTCPLEREPTVRRDDAQEQQHVLIAQLASSSPLDFARAVELLAPWVDGVDLNCGCPQSWACGEGIGCALMDSPELVAELVRAAKARLPRTKSVSVKIRVHKDLARTVAFVKTVEAAGVDFITVHGRTKSQRSSTPPDYAAIRMLKKSVNVPLIANGDAYTLDDVHKIAKLTGADGVMAARGLLENPALFAGESVTSPECVRRFLEYAVGCPIPFTLVLHHVSEMTAKIEGMGKRGRRELMQCRDLVDLVDFVNARWPDPLLTGGSSPGAFLVAPEGIVVVLPDGTCKTRVGVSSI